MQWLGKLMLYNSGVLMQWLAEAGWCDFQKEMLPRLIGMAVSRSCTRFWRQNAEDHVACTSAPQASIAFRVAASTAQSGAGLFVTAWVCSHGAALCM